MEPFTTLGHADTGNLAVTMPAAHLSGSLIDRRIEFDFTPIRTGVEERIVGKLKQIYADSHGVAVWLHSNDVAPDEPITIAHDVVVAVEVQS